VPKSKAPAAPRFSGCALQAANHPIRLTYTPNLRVLGAYLGASAFSIIAILLIVRELFVRYESCCAINSTT
jgi:hypothetical protein